MIKLIKIFSWAVILSHLTSCSDLNDCFSSSGASQTQIFEVDFFDKLVVRQNVSLEIIQSEEEFVEIKAGSNRIDEVYVFVQDSTLFIETGDLCTAGFSSAPVQAVVSTASLREIRNSSQFAIKGKGVLTYPRLALLSNRDFGGPTINVGDFDLEVDNEFVWINTSGASMFHIKGKTQRFDFGIYTATGKIEARNLLADTIWTSHRGYSEVHVSPKNVLKGEIRSTGNITLHRIPEIIDLEETFSGQLLIDENAIE